MKIKIKANRLEHFLNKLNVNKIKYEKLLENKYYYIVSVGKKESYNHIIFNYVVNSHVIIPQNILRRFGYKKDNWEVNYMSYPYKEISKSKIKDYGAEYGYYDMQIEEEIEKRYESKMGELTKELSDWQSKKTDSEDILINESLILDIFDMAIYRNPKYLKFYNENSCVSRAFGDTTPSEFIGFVFSHNFPHIFTGLRANIIVNKTEKNFIINKSMISIIKLNENKEEVMIMPITKKICLALISEDFYNEMKTKDRVCHMYIDDLEQIDLINERIFQFATFNNEEVIGNFDLLKELINIE